MTTQPQPERPDLAAWLLEQIAEDEQVAREVEPLNIIYPMGGQPHPERFTHPRLTYASEDGYPRRETDAAADRHFSRHDPARVLAECEAKRKIVALHGRTQVTDYPKGIIDVCTECGSASATSTSGDGAYVDWPCDTLRLLAQPYADRPGYDPNWGTVGLAI